MSTSFTNFSEYKKVIKKADDVIILPLKTKTVVVLSRENCPYCTMIKDKLKDYKDYVIIDFNHDQSLSYKDDFIKLPIKDRESINNTVNKFIEDSKPFGLFFPTILHGSELSLGLPTDNVINKIFKK